MRYKDCLKSGLNQRNVPIDNWEDLAHCREKWKKKLCMKAKKEFERKRMEHAKIKRKMRKGDRNDVLASINERDDLTCDECGKICLSKAGQKNHMKLYIAQSHIDYRWTNDFECINYADQKMACKGKVHGDVHYTITKFSCTNCQKTCKSLAGLKSHIRAAHR
uniref:C2H2-type domain-containing protein n=1 Tax=Octopus bimaculoides TaxID=37653 RepID=A0A0L8HF63_OCTBM|eukprot:XP_014772893.1 PREDICTED: PR domain zinc finger protein 10-like [Octopus bimaculoides]